MALKTVFNPISSNIDFVGDGDVVGPSSSTDTAVARFDGTTGKLLKNTSAVTITDGGATFIDATADAVQLKVQGHSTQTSDIVVIEKSDTTDLFRVSNTQVISEASLLARATTDSILVRASAADTTVNVRMDSRNGGSNGKNFDMQATSGGLWKLNDDTAAGTRIQVNPDGQVNMAFQPSFFAFKGTSTTGQSSGSSVDVVFGTEDFDVTGNYNNTTGVFTAPVAGKYTFSACVIIAIDGATSITLARIQFVRAGSVAVTYRANQISLSSAAVMTNHYSVGTITISMAASDTIKVQAVATTSGGTGSWTIDGDGTVRQTYFCGHMLS